MAPTLAKGPELVEDPLALLLVDLRFTCWLNSRLMPGCGLETDASLSSPVAVKLVEFAHRLGPAFCVLG